MIITGNLFRLVHLSTLPPSVLTSSGGHQSRWVVRILLGCCFVRICFKMMCTNKCRMTKTYFNFDKSYFAFSLAKCIYRIQKLQLCSIDDVDCLISSYFPGEEFCLMCSRLEFSVAIKTANLGTPLMATWNHRQTYYTTECTLNFFSYKNSNLYFIHISVLTELKA